VQFNHHFTVPAPIDEVWEVLRDIPKVAECLPGAVIDTATPPEYSGRLKVKVGPMAMEYGGDLTLTLDDFDSKTIELVGKGRELRGGGTAAATIRAHLNPSDASTVVEVQTDFDVTGKPAQFGGRVLEEVGGKLLGQFSDRLAIVMNAGTQDAASHLSTTNALPAASELNLMSLVDAAAMKRIVAVAAGLSLVGIALWQSIRRSRAAEPE